MSAAEAAVAAKKKVEAAKPAVANEKETAEERDVEATEQMNSSVPAAKRPLGSEPLNEKAAGGSVPKEQPWKTVVPRMKRYHPALPLWQSGLLWCCDYNIWANALSPGTCNNCLRTVIQKEQPDKEQPEE